MISTTLEMDAVTETFYDVRKLIYGTVWQFQKQHGGDFDEMVAEANLIYIKAFMSHNPSKGKFSTWLCFCLGKGLIDFRRFIREENRYVSIEHFEDWGEYQIQTPPRSTFLELINEVSSDTKTIIDLLMEPTNELQTALMKKKSVKYYHKQALRAHLTSVLGWSNSRIKESFQEIVEVLNDH